MQPQLLGVDSARRQDNRDCASDDVINTVSMLKKIGKEKYDAYVNNVALNRTVQIQQPNKNN